MGPATLFSSHRPGTSTTLLLLQRYSIVTDGRKSSALTQNPCYMITDTLLISEWIVDAPKMVGRVVLYCCMHNEAAGRPSVPMPVGVRSRANPVAATIMHYVPLCSRAPHSLDMHWGQAGARGHVTHSSQQTVVLGWVKIHAAVLDVVHLQ